MTAPITIKAKVWQGAHVPLRARVTDHERAVLTQAAVTSIRQSYRERDAEAHFSYLLEEGQGHVFSERMWEATRSTFRKHLPRGMP